MNQHVPLHWPAFRAGCLMHLTFGVVLLAAAVVTGPPLAWLLGQGAVSTVLALLAVVGRAVMGYWNAQSLWRSSAQPSMVVSTAVCAAIVGYTALHLPMMVLGTIAGAGLAGNAPSAGTALVLDATLMVAATASGALIAAGAKRRRRHSGFDATRIPLIREVAASFAEHRAKARMDP